MPLFVQLTAANPISHKESLKWWVGFFFNDIKLSVYMASNFLSASESNH